MRYLKIILFNLLIVLVTGINTAQAFSFDFGDDDDYYRPYYQPYYQPVYNPWFAPAPAYFQPRRYYFPPRLASYDRSTMVRKRQRVMTDHDDAMTRLFEMLYGDGGFNRADAIKMARKIEITSGSALTGNFHPGAVAAFRSRTTNAFWGNEQTFRANALALKAAAADLAQELEKKPAVEEGAILLPRRGFSNDDDKSQTIPVSADIWTKFNSLSHTCESCHNSFRGSKW